MGTKTWGNSEKAKILVIGHDPGLQRSQTIADYCFFADYYFKPKPSNAREMAKYRLAEFLFNCIRDLTSGQFLDEEVLITNLCNEELLPSPRGKTNYIPRTKAEEGLKVIRALLRGSGIILILPMSQQVNYWLQVLEFYPPNPKFLEMAEPKRIGIENKEPYYEPKNSRAFKEICGKKLLADNQYYLFPILHVKSYPLKGSFLTYEDNYRNCKKEIMGVIESVGRKE